MKKALFFLVFSLLAFSALAQVTIQPVPKRIYWSSTQLIIGNATTGAVEGSFVAGLDGILIYGYGSNLVAVQIGRGTDFYRPTDVLNSSGTTYGSSVSAVVGGISATYSTGGGGGSSGPVAASSVTGLGSLALQNANAISVSGGSLLGVSVNGVGSSTFGYLDATSSIQNQLNNKQASLGYTPLSPANNLSDVSSAATARTNLELLGMALQAPSSVTISGGTATLSSLTATTLFTSSSFSVGGDLLPSTNNVYSLGNSSLFFNKAYITNSYLFGQVLVGFLTSQTGAKLEVNGNIYGNAGLTISGTGSFSNVSATGSIVINSALATALDVQRSGTSVFKVSGTDNQVYYGGNAFLDLSGGVFIKGNGTLNLQRNNGTNSLIMSSTGNAFTGNVSTTTKYQIGGVDWMYQPTTGSSVFGPGGNGTMTGTNNTIAGSGAGVALTTGTGNTFIGYQAGASTTTGSNNIYLGNVNPSYQESNIARFPSSASVVIGSSASAVAGYQLQTTGSSLLDGLVSVGGNLVPKINFGASLGTSSLQWSDIRGFIMYSTSYRSSTSGAAIVFSNNTIETGRFAATTGNFLLGSTTDATSTSKIQITSGDIELISNGNGLVLRSPDGTRYRLTAANGGTVSLSAF